MIPQLRFPEFIDQWRVEKFDDIFERVTRKNKENDQNILTISAQDGLVSQSKYFSKLVAAKDVRNYYLLHKNDYAYNKSYSNGYPMGAIKRLIHDDKGVVSTLYICFSAKDPRSIQFFDQYFEAGKLNTEIEKIAQEGARNHGLLNMSVVDFFKLPLTVPSIPEQQKIADYMGGVDIKLISTQTKVAAMHEYKKGVMQALFSGKLRFKDESGNPYPDWEEKKLGDVFSERTERSGQGQMLSVTIGSGIVPFASLTRKDNSSADKSNYKCVKANDIAYNSMRMWQGASGVSDYDGIVSPAYTVITPKEENDSRFWGYRFKTTDATNTFQRYSQGLTSDTWNLKFNTLSKISFMTPCYDEQQKIADFLTTLDDKLKLEEAKLASAKEFKKALLQRMFV